MLLSDKYKFAAWNRFCWSGQLIRAKNFPNILIQFLFCKIDLPNVVWKLQHTNDFRVKMQNQPIYNWIRVTCGGSVRPVVWKAEYGHRPQLPSILDWSESCSCCFFYRNECSIFLKSGKQMIAPVDCLLNAANWEWLNKSEVEMLFLWVEKG